MIYSLHLSHILARSTVLGSCALLIDILFMLCVSWIWQCWCVGLFCVLTYWHFTLFYPLYSFPNILLSIRGTVDFWQCAYPWEAVFCLGLEVSLSQGSSQYLSSSPLYEWVFHEHETLVICVYSKKFLSLTGKLMT
jgi:hypothetical protein